MHLAKKVYQKYLKVGSTLELKTIPESFSAPAVQFLLNEAKRGVNVRESLFTEVQHEIFRQLSSGIFERFKKSEVYARYMDVRKHKYNCVR